MNTESCSVDSGLNYLSDFKAQEDELRKISYALDRKLEYCEIAAANSSKQKEENIDDIKTVLDPSSIGKFTTEEAETRSLTEVVCLPQNESGTIIGNESVLASPSLERPGKSSRQQLLECKEDIGFNAAVRFQKARAEAMTKKLEEAMDTRREMSERLACMENDLKNTRKDRNLLKKALESLKLTDSKLKKELKEKVAVQDSMKSEIASMKKDLAVAQKMVSAADSDRKNREVRLARALEECNKYKENIMKASSKNKEGDNKFKKENEALLAKVTMLERQRGELLIAFKKQLKLIDVLKRQNVHLEAAQKITFIEDEFIRVLDSGKKLKGPLAAS